jgi:hypothetical protein
VIYLNDIKKDPFFLNKMAILNRITKNCFIHTILPKRMVRSIIWIQAIDFEIKKIRYRALDFFIN